MSTNPFFYSPGYGHRPLNDTTPFTFRDSYTFLQKLDEFLQAVNTVENRELEFIKAVNQAVADGKEAADAFMADMTDKYQTILSQLIGYTIEVGTETYRASMMDGSIFEAYTIVGVDNKLTILRNELVDTVNTRVDELANTVNTRIANFETDVSKRVGETSNARFVTKYVAATASNPEYFVTHVFGVYKVPYAVTKMLGNSASGTHTLRTMDEFVRRSGCNFTTNASGWRETGDVMGLQIQNGVLLHGWDTHITYDQLGREALVIMKDGSWRVYDFTTPPAQIIADGGWNSFCWGHALYKNGEVQDVLGKPGYELLTARHMMGVTTAGVIVFATFPGRTGQWGASGGDVLQALSGYTWEFLYFLDGGGSAQQYHGLFPMVRSSDNSGSRAVADVIGFKGSLIGEPANVWEIVGGRKGNYVGGGISFLVRETSISIRVQSVTVDDVERNTWSTLFSLPAWVPKPLYQVVAVGYLGSVYVPIRIMPDGNVQATIPSSVTNGYLSFSVEVPIESNFRDYIVV